MALLLLVTVLVVAAPGPALAYIDSSAGSILLQLLLGGTAGLWAVVRLYGARISRFVRRGERDDEGAGEKDAGPRAPR
jgi:hypothetical protein